jgi:hypothetical protein
MTARWLFSPKGEAPYYQDGDLIYSKVGRTVFSVSDSWWYSIQTPPEGGGKKRGGIADGI